MKYLQIFLCKIIRRKEFKITYEFTYVSINYTIFLANKISQQKY